MLYAFSSSSQRGFSPDSVACLKVGLSDTGTQNGAAVVARAISPNLVSIFLTNHYVLMFP